MRCKEEHSISLTSESINVQFILFESWNNCYVG